MTLIQKVELADSQKQKGLRGKLRDMGFFWTDYHPQDEVPRQTMSLDAFHDLVRSGRVKVLSNGEDSPVSFEPPQVNKVPSPESPISSHSEGTFKQCLPPWVDERSRILVLGTLPGGPSLRQGRYYASPGNSFWRVMNLLLKRRPEEHDDKEFILSRGVALWDTAKSGNREGSGDDGFDDSTVTGNDIQGLLDAYPGIRAIILNGKGKTVDYFYGKCRFVSSIPVKALISTSYRYRGYHETSVMASEWAAILPYLTGGD